MAAEGSALRIGVDGTIWGGEESGVSVSTRRLFLALARRDQHEFIVFISKRAAPMVESLGGNPSLRFLVVPSRTRLGRIAWQQFRLPELARREALDVLYCPCYTQPLAFRGATVLTVHDMIAYKRPELPRRLNIVHMRALLRASVQRARQITVPTETVKRDLLSIFRLDADRVHVVPWGVDLEVRPLPKAIAKKQVRDWYGIDSQYVLFVGAGERKKNLPTLVKAMQQVDLRLVLAGIQGRGSSGSRWAARQLGEERCQSLGYVPADRLGALYSAAEVFAFPSRIEGFGLPVLEAMACGTPVVTSDAPALREICGGAAIHVPSTDTAALVAGLQHATQRSEQRARLIRSGHARAAQFTWSRSAELFLKAARQASE